MMLEEENRKQNETKIKEAYSTLPFTVSLEESYVKTSFNFSLTYCLALLTGTDKVRLNHL